MKFVALVSGGKDSIYSILESIRHGHELLACVHLGAAAAMDPDEQHQREAEGEEESYMYQSAASEALTALVEECLEVPLVLYRRVGKSLDTSLVYQEALSGDEVEDLYRALALAKERFPDVQAVSSGAILSTYQRVRIEHVCRRLDLTSLSYLWRMAPQHELLDRMICDGITAVLVRAACPPGLLPHKHLNKTLQELQPHFLRLNQLYQFHVCGEGGEYESLVLDCPLYKRRLVLDEVEIVEMEGDEGVGVLKILKCHAEPKNTVDKEERPQKEMMMKNPISDNNGTSQKPSTGTSNGDNNNTLTTQSATFHTNTRIRYLPAIKSVSGGLWHISEIMAPALPSQSRNGASEADLAVQEAQDVLQLLQIVLQQQGCTAQDVLFVHLYLSEISHFASINAYYKDFFGTLLPPSRSCVAVGPNVLPGGRRVALDCMVQTGSGDYLRGRRDNHSPYAQAARANTASKLRQVLHVQSISHWAPVCVGPYSQVNTLRSSVHFMAGQIGLIPATMTLHPSWKDQLHQCWTNVASVLDALEGGSLAQLLSGVVYVADDIYFHHMDSGVSTLCDVETICRIGLEQNGDITAGKVDSPIASSDRDEDADSCTSRKGQHCPLLILSIPEMPVGAKVEVEVIAASQQAASCLPITDAVFSSEIENPSRLTLDDDGHGWDTGHDFHPLASELASKHLKVDIEVAIRCIGYGCACVATVTAGLLSPDISDGYSNNVNSEEVLRKMLAAFEHAVASEGLRSADTLHVRLFYVASKIENSGEKTVQDDGMLLRPSLKAAIASHFSLAEAMNPASSIVPVQAINRLTMKECTRKPPDTDPSLFLALQILIIDPIRLDSELWVHYGR